MSTAKTLQENPWPKILYHEEGQTTYLDLPSDPNQKQIFICEGCGTGFQLTENQLQITNDELGKQFNITLRVLWPNMTQAFVFQSSIWIVSRLQLNCINSQFQFEHFFNEMEESVTLLSLNSNCFYQCNNCSTDIFKVEIYAQEIKISTFKNPQINQQNGEIDVLISREILVRIPYQIKFIRNLQSGCAENMAFVNPYNLKYFYVLKGSGTVTLPLASFTCNPACQTGTPDIDFNGPEGSADIFSSDCDVYNTPAPTYNSVTKRWNCPHFAMTDIQSYITTDGYSLFIDSNGPVTINKSYIFNYYYEGYTSSIHDSLVVRFTTDPCAVNVYNVPILPDLYLSYQGPAVTYIFTDFQTSTCGSWSYKWLTNTVTPAQDISQIEIGTLEWNFQWILGLLSDFTLDTPYISTIQGFVGGILKTQANFNVYFVCETTSITSLLPLSPTTSDYIIGNAGLTWNYPTFLHTAACGYNLTYLLLVDGLVTFPVWFNYVANSNFTILTSNVAFAGTHNITIQTSYPGLLADTQTITINFINPCFTTGWNPNSIADMKTTVLVEPSLVQIYSPFSTVSTICGPINYVLSPLQTFLQLDTILNTLTVKSVSDLDIKVYDETLTGSLVDYPDISLTISFKVTIDPCVITSLVPSNNLNSQTPQIIYIYDNPTLVTLASYIQTPACGYLPNISLDATSYPIPSTFQSFPFWTQYNSIQGQVFSNDYTINNFEYTLRQVTTIDLFPQQIVSKVYQFIDPCIDTFLIETSLPNIDSFIYADSFQIQIPILNDTVSQTYPFGTCFTQSLSIMENGTSILYASLEGNIMTINANEPEYSGNHTIDVKYAMKRYPTITLSLSFMLRLFALLSPPDIANQTYQVNNPALLVNSDLFNYVPISADMILTHTVSMLDGSTLPDFIKYTIQDQNIQFQFFSQTASDVGTIMIKISANLVAVTGTGVNITEIKTLQISIIAESANITVNKLPYFVQNLTSSFDVFVGEPWSYTLPDAFDLEEIGVQVTASLGQAVYFMKFKNNTLSIGVTDESQINTYIILLTVSDSQGGFSTSYIRFNLKSLNYLRNFITNQEDNLFKTFYGNITKPETFNATWPSHEFNPIWIESVSMTGVVTFRFGQQILVPNLNNQSNASISDFLISKQIELSKTNLSEPNPVLIKWTALSISENNFTLQLKFQDPLSVSKFEKDQLQAKFLKNNLFLLKDGQGYLFYKSNQTYRVQSDIPQQFLNDEDALIAQQITISTYQASASTVFITVLVQLFGKELITLVWLFFCAIQLIIYMNRNLKIDLPPTASVFNDALEDIITLNSTKNYFFDQIELPNLKDNSLFQSIGGISLLILVTILIAVLITCMVKVCKNKLHGLIQKVQQTIFWNFFIRYLYASYLNFTHVSMTKIINEDSTQKDQLISIAILSIQSYFVLSLLTLVTRKQSIDLKIKTTKKKIGFAYNLLEVTVMRKRLYQFLFFIQRIFIVFIVLYATSYGLQNSLILLILMAHVIYLLQVQPYENRNDMIPDLINEIMLLICQVFQMCLSPWQTNYYISYKMGQFYPYIIASFYFFNLANIVFTIAKDICRQKLLKRLKRLKYIQARKKAFQLKQERITRLKAYALKHMLVTQNEFENFDDLRPNYNNVPFEHIMDEKELVQIIRKMKAERYQIFKQQNKLLRDLEAQNQQRISELNKNSQIENEIIRQQWVEEYNKVNQQLDQSQQITIKETQLNKIASYEPIQDNIFTFGGDFVKNKQQNYEFEGHQERDNPFQTPMIIKELQNNEFSAENLQLLPFQPPQIINVKSQNVKTLSKLPSNQTPQNQLLTEREIKLEPKMQKFVSTKTKTEEPKEIKDILDLNRKIISQIQDTIETKNVQIISDRLYQQIGETSDMIETLLQNEKHATKSTLIKLAESRDKLVQAIEKNNKNTRGFNFRLLNLKSNIIPIQKQAIQNL